MNKKTVLGNLLIVLLVLVLTVFPLLYARDAAFEGADNLAGEVITEINPDYEPWFNSIWEPPSGEIESLLFVLQGMLGAGFVFYYLGYLKGRKQVEENNHAID